MQARIYQNFKSPTRSASNDKGWVLSFPKKEGNIDDTMGWSSSEYSMTQVSMQFDNMSDAKNFAISKGWDVEIIEGQPKSAPVKKSYSDNFID